MVQTRGVMEMYRLQSVHVLKFKKADVRWDVP